MQEVRKVIKMLTAQKKTCVSVAYSLLLNKLTPFQMACGFQIHVSFLVFCLFTANCSFSEVLNDLANVEGLNIPETVASIPKRPRSPESSPSPLSAPDLAETARESRPVASSRRFQAYQQAHSPEASSSRSESSHPPSLSPASNSGRDQPAPPVLDSFPPLSSHSGIWPSSSTISTMSSDPFPLSPFVLTSSAANVAFKPATLQPQPEPFPPLDQSSPPLPDFSPTGFLNNSSFAQFTGSSGAYAPSAQSSNLFGMSSPQMNGVLDSDTLAMWSCAPSGFE